MEFVHHDEIAELLREHGVRSVEEAELVHLEMADSDTVVHLHLTGSDCTVTPREGATIVNVAEDQLANVVEHAIHRLRPHEVILIPVRKWRDVFDAVAFSLAENEEWQQVDAAATVELNTRDPLLCEPGDFHTLFALLKALLQDGENPEQGLMLLTAATPVLVEVLPAGAVRISVGNQVLADEVTEALPA